MWLRFGSVLPLLCVSFVFLGACSSSEPGPAETAGSGGAAPGGAGSPIGGPSAVAGGGAGAALGGAASGGANTLAGAAGSVGVGGAAAGTANGGASTVGGVGGTAGAGGTASASNGCTETSVGYFVDSSAGNDSSAGKTPATAWKSLDKANAVTLKPGDHLCLRAGSSWTGKLAPQGSGSSAAPVVIDKYGAGDRPRISAGANDKDAVSLVNFAYVELNNLEVTNKKSALGDYRGVSVVGRDAGTLNHLQIRGCFVHDVTGEVNWIGGDVADNATGVTFQTGWDASKRTGGIVVEVASTAAQPVKTIFNDVLIENNVIQNTSFGGIVFKQLDGTVHWGVRDAATDAQFSPHTNVIVRNNFIDQADTQYGCNGVYMTGVQTGLIEGNVVAHAGTSAIEVYYTDAVTIQKNETFGTVKKAGGADSNGIDTDKGTTKSIIQYNYIHDNGDGILLCQFSFGDSVIRYNILQNNSRYQLYLHSDSKAKAAIYNNTFYGDKYAAALAYGYGDSLAAAYVLTNNIFVSTKASPTLTTGGGIVYQKNLYFGANVSAPAGDSGAIKADPKLMAPGQGTNGSAAGPAFASLGGYKLQAGSPALNAGSVMADNGGKDFFGTALPASAPDMGAAEMP